MDNPLFPRIHGFVALMVLVAVGYWSWNCVKFVWNTNKYLEIKIFYRDVLKIPEVRLGKVVMF